ncbi:hypothetical protein [Endozoicomonas sp. ONNA2]|uniref:hypothetical protein n=1 Tax=Endozoicomonas sp. ONNA2 TaxID=2828741 RepID=UPI00214890CD|nr:hypothetical protein [Endozoicomonas sp. ONNA2]
MNTLPNTTTGAPAVYVPQSRDKQVSQAFAGDKEVKPTAIANKCPEYPSERAGSSLLQRTVTLSLGNQDAQSAENRGAASASMAPWLEMENAQTLHKLKKVMQKANNLLANAIEQNLSESDALSMTIRAYSVMEDLHSINGKLTISSKTANHNNREIIDQKISELKQVATKLESAYK